MPFQIVRNNIISMQVDAIVNPTDTFYSGSGGTDAEIHHAAGSALTDACRLLPPLISGQTAVTPGFNLPCRYIIHTVGPIWRGGTFQEEATLFSCYQLALEQAAALRCGSIAFPLISSGTFGFPKDRVLKVALSAIGSFLLSHDMNVWIVVYDKESYTISKKLQADIDAFIDDEYIDLHTSHSRSDSFTHQSRKNSAANRYQWVIPSEASPFSSIDSSVCDNGLAAHASYDTLDESSTDEMHFSSKQDTPDEDASISESAHLENRPFTQAHPYSFSHASPASSASVPMEHGDLSTLFLDLDEGFSGTLLKLIDRSGLSDVECYKRANIDKRLFSKIRSNPDYHPSKQTALAFAVALHLSVEETQKLLETAGLTLSRSSKFDVIIKYFLSQKQYNIYEINEVLYRYDQPCLGNVML